ncbi:hypothetical protein CH375_19905 [Leptospira ellisii]|nr:hypothetical protein CH375_19905 [Leptospira ellisii]
MEKFRSWMNENGFDETSANGKLSRNAANHGPGLEAVADLKEELGIDFHADSVLVSAYQGWGLKILLDLLEKRIYEKALLASSTEW